ncbi:hypothetical protein SESBI_32002 [Sesbania bispinosa]|nr:hypothetical protein SESBI_32002 [Sesbania bispinosa]
MKFTQKEVEDHTRMIDGVKCSVPQLASATSMATRSTMVTKRRGRNNGGGKMRRRGRRERSDDERRRRGE